MKIITKIAATLCVFSIFGCSSTNNLRKFDDGDIGKEISADVAKKFEVRDAGASAAKAAPIANTVPEAAKKKAKKGKKSAQDKAGASAPIAEEPPNRKPAKLPFIVGEKLQYDIRYLGLTAGYLNLEVEPEKEVNSRSVYHLVAKAKTVKFFEMIYRVDDTIESFWDTEGMYSHRFTMNLDESKQSRKLIELYDYDKKKSFYWNRVDHTEKGFSEQKQEYDIKLWSQDVLSAMYYIRTIELPKEPGKEVRFPVILDGRPWETVIKFTKTGSVYANGKNYDANIFQIENYENGQAKNKENTLWVSQDDQKLILRVEAKVKVGSFAVALEKIL